MTDFEEIYRQYFDRVYLYILKLSGNEHTAEDVTSETFFKAMKAIGTFRGDCDISVWLCQIAKNCYYSESRKNKNAADADDEMIEAIPSGELVDDAVVERETADELRAVLHELPEQYKEVFMWRTFAELSFSQIGDVFGKSENWACVTYHRARKMIMERSEEKRS